MREILICLFVGGLAFLIGLWTRAIISWIYRTGWGQEDHRDRLRDWCRRAINRRED